MLREASLASKKDEIARALSPAAIGPEVVAIRRRQQMVAPERRAAIGKAT
jgi:hypothetical protein